MSLAYNGTETQGITWNGADVQTVTYNGVEVWSAHPPFLVRMRYDANEATHVKDLVGGYTITTDTGGAVPAAADPFGGNNALNLDDIWIYYDGSKIISGLNSTVTMWVKLSGNGNNFILCSSAGDNRYIWFPNGKPTIGTSSAGSSDVDGTNIYDGKWHFVEISTNGTLVRIFIDGILTTTGTAGNLTSYPNWKPSDKLWIGQWPTNYYRNKFKGNIYDLCILNGVWHTENYNVPTAYI